MSSGVLFAIDTQSGACCDVTTAIIAAKTERKIKANI